MRHLWAKSVGKQRGRVLKYILADRVKAAAPASDGPGWFDRVVNGLNRLPRPLMALGTIALLALAMADPAGFARRMLALKSMPEELWWLTGGVITFYFGARESHYRRGRVEPLAKSPGERPEGAGLPTMV